MIGEVTYVTYQPIQFDHNRRRARFWPAACQGRADLPSKRCSSSARIANERRRRSRSLKGERYVKLRASADGVTQSVRRAPDGPLGASLIYFVVADTLLSRRRASISGVKLNAKHNLEARPWWGAHVPTRFLFGAGRNHGAMRMEGEQERNSKAIPSSPIEHIRLVLEKGSQESGYILVIPRFCRSLNLQIQVRSLKSQVILMINLIYFGGSDAEVTFWRFIGQVSLILLVGISSEILHRDSVGDRGKTSRLGHRHVSARDQNVIGT
ncbi:hypothetical protein B0H19DRAFT_1058883 [Mycena capillaripes]|nr:hypothetical protein B0H19DRAFT_1058883 [Mycena capillaripes]